MYLSGWLASGAAGPKLAPSQPRNSSRSWGGGSTPIIRSRMMATSAAETSVSGQLGQGERRESATVVRLDGDEMPADAHDGDAAHFPRTYMRRRFGQPVPRRSQAEGFTASALSSSSRSAITRSRITRRARSMSSPTAGMSFHTSIEMSRGMLEASCG